MSEYSKLKKRAKESLFELKLITRKSRKKIGEKTFNKGIALGEAVKVAIKSKDWKLRYNELE